VRGEAGLISHLALCRLSACIGLRWLIILALVRRLLACNLQSGHRCICLTTGRYIYTYLGSGVFSEYTTADTFEDSRHHGIYINIYICYSYTTVRVWYRSYYTSTRWSRVQVLITMISYVYTWYNWLVPCQRNWNQHSFKYLFYFAKQDQYNLFEQSV